MGNIDTGSIYPLTVEGFESADGMCWQVIDTSHGDRAVSGCIRTAIGAHNHARAVKRDMVQAEIAREQNDAALRCLNTGAQCGSGDAPWDA
jgi:hypothetical protein